MKDKTTLPPAKHSGRLMKKAYIALAVACSTVVIVSAATYIYTMSLGRQSLLQLAKEGGFCKQADCADGIDYASSFLANEFGLSQRGVQWCIGVDEFARRDFILGEGARNLLTEPLYIPCNDHSADDEGTALPVDAE